MDKGTAEMILGMRPVNEGQENLIEIFRQHLSLDNNKLREDVVLSYLGYIPSFMGSGHPDGFKLDNTPVDNKSGPNITFPDGSESINKKKDWVCTVTEFSKNGQLIYIAEVLVSDIWDELIESRDTQISVNADKDSNKSQRVSPEVKYNVWLNKTGTKIVYVNPEAFPRTPKGQIVSQFSKIYETYKKGM